jgi:hypothetical protein
MEAADNVYKVANREEYSMRSIRLVRDRFTRILLESWHGLLSRIAAL